MSKFEEMCSTFAKARQDWIEYRDRCVPIYAKFVQGFVKYCEIPPDLISFLNPTDTEKKIEPEPLPLAMQFRQEDNYWTVGLRITLYEGPNVLPYQNIWTEIWVREKDGKTIFKLSEKGKPHEIDLTKEDQCRPLYDEIVQRVNNFFSESMKRAMQKEDASIGFKITS